MIVWVLGDSGATEAGAVEWLVQLALLPLTTRACSAARVRHCLDGLWCVYWAL